MVYNQAKAKMKKTVLMLITVVTAGMLAVSCGGGSNGSEGNAQGQSGKVLSKVVSVIQDAKKQADKLEAKAKDCNDMECLGKIMDESKKAKEAYETNLQKAIESASGKSIATEVQDFPVKVSVPATVVKMSKGKRPNCDMELELTEDITVNNTKETFAYLMYITFVDKEGNKINDKAVSLFGDYKVQFGQVIPAGTKFKHSFDIPISEKNVDKWENFEKIVLKKKSNN